MKWIRQFIQLDSAGGIVMMVATAIALIIANSPLFSTYHHWVDSALSISILGHPITISTHMVIKDGLMALFFLLVGLELKQEMTAGVLSKPDQLLLPLFAAIAGMIIPALIYIGITHEYPQLSRGWAIPSATDIAFALAVLMMVGRQVPAGVKVFLLAIAIFDDLGAIAIIAFFYNTAIHWSAIGFSLLGVFALFVLSKQKVQFLLAYLMVGIYLWVCLHHAGIHPTIAGAIVGVMVPTVGSSDATSSPSKKLIQLLHPWVAFLILPIFAFTSAGVRLIDISLSQAINPLSIGVGAALFFGKQLGIFSACWALIKLRWVSMPKHTNWMQIYGVSVIAGIGFTVSLFISELALPADLQTPIKIGIIGGSLLSAIWGATVIKLAATHHPSHQQISPK